MNRPARKLSTRFTRKGALIEETYAAFQHWDLSMTFRKNIERIQEENLIGAPNEKWLHEIAVTLSSRFGDHPFIAPLVLMAQGHVPLFTWKPCLLWHVGMIDALYYRFVTEWLFPRFQEGAYVLRTEDALDFVRHITDGKIASGGKLSEYGALRAARDLLKMACDFDLLEGKVKRKFATRHIPQEAFLYVLRGLMDMGLTTSQAIASLDWRLFLMDADDVEREILTLHQYQILQYHVAGSIVQLTLSSPSLEAYAKELAS
ncbi:MAG: BrxA family protein [Deltaproteobacteria bacterium]|nr:BrxA family protein [Deltaproteobacteria bacterium]